MREKVAVATVQGKPYFLIVNQLREQNIPFISILPGQSLPINVKLVITTEQEKQKIKHEKIFIFHDDEDLETMVNEVKRSLIGKEAYEKIVIGLDPGAVTGLAVIADGKVIDENNCLSPHEIIVTIQKAIRKVNFNQTSVTVKIGNGVPIYHELLEELDNSLPPEVKLEVVNEFGTNRSLKENRRSRKIRHISSAKRIAGRSGRLIERRKLLAWNNRNQ
jgi:transcriptional accessory protein Tex/SPT6